MGEENNQPRIFIIDDAVDVCDFLRRGLSEEGFAVEVAHSGGVALRRADEPWDLIILDLMLPEVQGETILDYLGQKRNHPPVLVLTARDQLEDKVALFRLGCDDYLTKPFAFEELLERVKAILRRAPTPLSETYIFEDMTLDSGTHKLQIGPEKVVLTPKEFAICRALMSQPGQVISRKQLLHSVWGLTHEPKTNFIEVHLANLRRKLAPLGRGPWFQTVRSSGFVLSRPENHAS